MIVWREKFIATAIHFLVTLALAACAAALIFLVWFPSPFATMIGGTEQATKPTRKILSAISPVS